MSKGEHRRFTAEQKIAILREAEQPGVRISEVCRRHGLATSVFYRWRAFAQGGAAVALKRDAHRTRRKDDAEARRKAEIERMLAERRPFSSIGGNVRQSRGSPRNSIDHHEQIEKRSYDR